MCIIMLANGRRVTESEIERATIFNNDGNGFAWRRKDGTVRWKKGLNFQETVRLAKSLPLPYAFHARMATVGSATEELTHPFPIEIAPSLALSGKTDVGVFFHNGHVAEWRTLLALAEGTIEFVDETVWSDSRALAHLVAECGPKFLPHIDGSRFLLFGPRKTKMIGTWRNVDGVFMSTTLPPNYYASGTVTGRVPVVVGGKTSSDFAPNRDKYPGDDGYRPKFRGHFDSFGSADTFEDWLERRHNEGLGNFQGGD